MSDLSTADLLFEVLPKKVLDLCFFFFRFIKYQVVFTNGKTKRQSIEDIPLVFLKPIGDVHQHQQGESTLLSSKRSASSCSESSWKRSVKERIKPAALPSYPTSSTLSPGNHSIREINRTISSVSARGFSYRCVSTMAIYTTE